MGSGASRFTSRLQLALVLLAAPFAKGADSAEPVRKEPAPAPKIDEAPLTKAELKVWTDYLDDLDAKGRRIATAEWNKVSTNRAKRALIRLIPPDEDEPPITNAELRLWTDYLGDLTLKDRKYAEALWKKAKTNRARRVLIRSIPVY